MKRVTIQYSQHIIKPKACSHESMSKQHHQTNCNSPHLHHPTSHPQSIPAAPLHTRPILTMRVTKTTSGPTALRILGTMVATLPAADFGIRIVASRTSALSISGLATGPVRRIDAFARYGAAEISALVARLKDEP
ncbi:hypothetical protein BDV41DRAFT_333987 [Aspergillus transmontanensis]|uniref:Uncharacterized protein n=1 Tax=Aspergillus transmontanensis TaxID=1034304 RepID=A0A5N6VTM3_9EURO|nr:hypothetical protein BDV41DRAFT_333987 [Aspergillus transmontanensis]